MQESVAKMGLPDEGFNCGKCGANFTTKSDLSNHLVKTHSECKKDEKVQCDQCKKYFVKYSLKAHAIAVHEKKRPYKCDFCGKCFATNGTLKDHRERIHLKDTLKDQYECETCHKQFKFKKSLKTHIRVIHKKSDILKVVCNYCFKTYTNKDVLRDHMKRIQYMRR